MSASASEASPDMASKGTAMNMELFSFDRQHLRDLAARHASDYRYAEPFPHIVLDDFLPESVLKSVIAEFPRPEDIDWHRFDIEQEVKLASEHASDIPPYIAHVLAQLNSAAMVEFLEELTGIDGLIPDPHLEGAGLHQIETGGRLKVHADFNRHERLRLDRRLNLIVYLNEGWQPEWGGALELWDRTMTACRERVLPVANRCVIFSTTDYSFHGHPDPLTCPPGETRKSMALYYYSNGRPASEVSPARTTRFQARPGESWRRPTSDMARDAAKQLTPPLLLDAVRRVKQRTERP
jgi:hypothetical protein